MKPPDGTISKTPRQEIIQTESHPLRKAGGAILNWWRAATLDALCVGLLWLIGLWLLHVPWAPFWAFIAALAQFIPNFGGMIALIGPALGLLFAGRNWEQFGLLLCLYAAVVFIDQLFLHNHG